MKTRRHHNAKGIRQIQRGKTRKQMEQLAKRLGVPYGTTERHKPHCHLATDANGEYINCYRPLGGCTCAEASPAGSPWQDISTAPKDGTRILIFDAAWCGGRARQTVSRWQRYERIDDGSRQECGSWSGVTKATHWMPLPSPPDDLDATIPQQAKK